jgi:OFA family oxalate/formate antiporter-like MFS transporter
MTIAPTPRAPRFYYGWWIVFGAMAAQFAAVGGSLQVAGVFLRPVTSELGWSSGEYALAGSLAFGVGGLLGFVIGPLVDRVGARPLMLVGGVTYATALILASRVNAPWQFIGCQMAAGGFGQALSGPLVVNITLSKWFVIRRGWALAMGSIGISLAGLIAPIGMTQVVDHFGWRDGYVVLGIVVGVVLLPVALLMRRTPEDYGLLPDGRSRNEPPSAANTAVLAELDRDYQNSYTRSEAIRTPGVWLITVGMGFFGAAMTAVLVHGIPFMTDAGLTRAQASVGIAVAGLANLLSKFVWGASLRRFETRILSRPRSSPAASGRC